MKTEFAKLKKDLGFKSSYEDLEKVGFIEDMILTDGYVSPNFSRQLINRISEKVYSWVSVLHSWIMPNPQDMIYSAEAKKLSQEEKQEIYQLIAKIMYFVRKSKRLSFEETSEEGKFIDELTEFDRGEFSEIMKKYHKKFESFWEDKEEQE